MKTNGLVRKAALALPLLFPSLGYAAEEVQLSSLLEEVESIEMEAYASDLVAESSFVEDSSVAPVAHHAARAGRRQTGGYWFAGMETTMYNVNARSGGIITASFSDTTAPGVSTFATVDGNGVNDKFAIAPRIWGRPAVRREGASSAGTGNSKSPTSTPRRRQTRTSPTRAPISPRFSRPTAPVSAPPTLS